MYSGVKTSELDDLIAQTCAYMAGTHPDFSKLAARVIDCFQLTQKQTLELISEVATQLYFCRDEDERWAPLLSRQTYKFITKYKDVLNRAINYQGDFYYNYFGFKALERLDC